MEAGALDWEAAMARRQREQVEVNMNAPRISGLLDRPSRAAALARVARGGASVAETASVLSDFQEGLTLEYSHEHACSAPHCRCGQLVTSIVRVDWGYSVDVGKEFNLGHASLLAFGVVAYSRKSLKGAFSTYHPACERCGPGGYSKKASFEQNVERLPDQLKHLGFQSSPPPAPRSRLVPPPLPPSASADAAVPPPLPPSPPPVTEPALFHVWIQGMERGPFSTVDLARMLRQGQLSAQDAVRVEGMQEPATVSVVLGV